MNTTLFIEHSNLFCMLINININTKQKQTSKAAYKGLTFE
jgi:hypothetical protein